MNSKTLLIAKGVLKKERNFLAKAITLIESNNKEHRKQSSLLLQYIIDQQKHSEYNNSSHDHQQLQYNKIDNRSNNTIRIGIAGPPGIVYCSNTIYY